MFNSQFQVAPFKEHPIVDPNTTEPSEFDIIAFDQSQSPDFMVNNKFSLQQYCICLFHRLFLLDKSDIKPFIQYQCEQLHEPFIWLNKFEKLIDLNRKMFTDEQNIKIEKALVVIEVLRQDIQSNKFDTKNKYNFDVLKKKLKKYNTPEEQLSCLYEAQAEYLQNKPKYIDVSEISFDAKIDIEIEKIEKQEQLRNRMPGKVSTSKNKVTDNKIMIRGNLNVLVDVFYQMLYEKKIGSLPYIDATPTEITTFIINNFLDREGQVLSESTVRTMLSPNKPEKRPKQNNKIEF